MAYKKTFVEFISYLVNLSLDVLAMAKKDPVIGIPLLLALLGFGLFLFSLLKAFRMGVE